MKNQHHEKTKHNKSPPKRLTMSRRSNGFNSRNNHQTTLDQSISDLKSVHNTIQYDWPDFLEQSANPIQTAVGLLDDTSVGMAHRYPEFTSVKQSTENALRVVVNEHHELFNNSIGSYYQLLTSLKDSQDDSKGIKEMLESTTKDIQDRSDTLSDLSQTSTRYSEMIEILDAITEMTGIQDKIDRLVADKKIHQVYDVIAHGYRIAEKYNLWTLPAMRSVQSYLEIQSNNLFDMIIDELQIEIYLKNFAANSSSWQSVLNSNNPKLSSLKLLAELNNLEQYIYNSANLDLMEILQVFTAPTETFLTTQLPKLHEHYSKNTGRIDYSILLESSLTVALESFHYVYMLLFTASKLNRLHQVVEILTNNNQLELHGLINRTIEAVKLKNLSSVNKLKNALSTFADIIGNNFSDSSIPILQDLFGGVFVKSLAVLQMHKIVSETVHIIDARSGSERIYEIDTIWKTVTKELQSLVTNYIYDTQISQPLIDNSLSVVLQKDTFKLEDVTYDHTVKSPEDLQVVLQEMFPGYVLNLKSEVESGSPYIKNERFNALVEVLVPKNLFNMRIILENFLLFISGSQRIFKNDAPLKYFDNFMRTNFLAHVKKNLDISFKEFVGHKLKLDLISLDDIGKSTIIYQNALDFKRLFLNVCSILNTSITYRKEISSTVLGFLQDFSNSYANFYGELLDDGKMILQVSKCMAILELVQASLEVIRGKSKTSLQSENQIILSEVRNLNKDDLLNNESFNHICYLLLTTTWILTWLPLLKKESNFVETELSTVDKLREDWSFLENGRSLITVNTGNTDISEQHVYLALNTAKSVIFDEIVEKFQNIKANTLLALRYDLRCKTIYYIVRSCTQTDWMPVTEPGDADQYIALLNKEVFSIENKLTKFLSDHERDSIFVGLPEFLNDLMIQASRWIETINSNGIKRILLNIHTLQQMLRSVLKNPETVNFVKASVYFDLFTLNEFNFLITVKENEDYTRDDYENMARMVYSEKLLDGGSLFSRTKYGELMKKIGEK